MSERCSSSQRIGIRIREKLFVESQTGPTERGGGGGKGLKRMRMRQREITRGSPRKILKLKFSEMARNASKTLK